MTATSAATSYSSPKRQVCPSDQTMPAILEDTDGITAHAIDVLERSRRMRETFSTRPPASGGIGLEQVALSPQAGGQWRIQAIAGGGKSTRASSDDRITALESIVAQQHESLQQVMDELLLTSDMARALQTDLGHQNARLRQLEARDTQNAAHKPAAIESQNSLTNMHDSKPANGPDTVIQVEVAVVGDEPDSPDPDSTGHPEYTPSEKKEGMSLKQQDDKIAPDGDSPGIPGEKRGRGRGSKRTKEPTRMNSAKQKHAVHDKRGREIDTHDSDEYQWSGLNENAYGAFIHTALSAGIQTSLAKCLLPVALSFCIQGVFSIELFLSLPDIYESTHHLCTIPSDLQLSAVFVFVVSECRTRPMTMIIGRA